MVEGGGSDNNRSSIHAETGRRTCLDAMDGGMLGERAKIAEGNADDGDVALLGKFAQTVLAAYVVSLCRIDVQEGR